MTVKELISILEGEVKPVDREIANIEFWLGEEELDVESMGGFSISADIIINLKKIKSPLLKPATFKNEHSEKVKEVRDKIEKEVR